MKEIVRTCALTALGAVSGNLLYVHTRGDPGDYHWIRTLMFAILFATAVVLLRKHRHTGT